MTILTKPNNDFILGAPGPFTLGTAQLGLVYGLGTARSPLVAEAATSILDAAANEGVIWLDTARAYGSSEARVGQWIATRGNRYRIVSKIPSLAAVSKEEAGAMARRELNASLHDLGISRLDVCLTHHATDLLRPTVADALRQAQNKGEIGSFGASVYTVDDGKSVLKVDGVGALQVPFSVVHTVFRDTGFIAEAAARGITIFARSVFLQGALLLSAEDLPSHLTELASVNERLQQLANEARVTLSALLIAVVKGVPGIYSPILGVDRVEQVNELIVAANTSAPGVALIEDAFRTARGLSKNLIDPRRWPKT